MSMKQLESFLARANGNDNIRREVEQCGGDTACVAKVGLRHGHKFSAANYTRWQREHK
ncbi:Nif11 family protein [Synechococcus sp. NOUM97013]|uniref:Nif11 family protein n=1 Tax=Synechococcus sp. NOUM97013 TaxID=1442555 RepID=UPI001647E715|nr:Nif11 family protein [Synechococcus sp. NOUM97013]QNI73885.1 nif11-like leader peptide domain protein [Synechococcus sp. NOUM97013]